MRVLLDTNVVSELRKVRSGKADPGVSTWAERIDAADLYLPSIAVLELELGVLLMERRDPAQGSLLRAWLDHQVLPAFDQRILPVDAGVARIAAGLHVPDPRPVRDALIAATAIAHGMTLATRNVVDFAGTGVALLNPWGDRAAE